MQAKQKLVVIGAGMAAERLLRRLHSLAPDRYAITLIGAEPDPAYNRVLLSSLLAGEVAEAGLKLATAADYAAWGVTQVLGDPVVGVDRGAACVHTRAGAAITYDRLVLACGSSPIVPAWPGIDAPQVLGFRTLADVRAMQAFGSLQEPVVVIGGGLLGIEAASGLAHSGAPVQLVHLAPHLLERQLDAAAGALLKSELERRGIRIHLGTETKAIDLDEHGAVRGLATIDGRLLPARWVVLAIGIRPNTELARQAGLTCERGVLVDDALCTNDPSIFAIGECAQHRGICYGLVAPVWEQAEHLAQVLSDAPIRSYQGSITAAALKVSGVAVFSAGDHNPGPNDEVLLVEDLSQAVYRKLVIRDGRLHGLVLYGDTTDGAWYLELLARQRKLNCTLDTLAFGRSYFSEAELQDLALEA